MTFLAPIAALIAAGITIPLLVAMYFLKLRRRLVVVSSTLLWKRAIRDLQVNAPFQRLRKSLLLFLQLLILATMLLALARPTFQQGARPGQRMVILIDHSASMNATDVSPTRLDEAKRLALKLVDDLGSPGSSRGGVSGGGGVMVIGFGQRSQVVQSFTTDQPLLRSQIESIQPSDESSRLESALQLVEPYAADTGSSSNRDSLVVYVISDGRMEDRTDLALRGADVRFVRVGKSPPEMPDNLAIVALAARRDLKRPELVQAFARLANYGPKRIDTNVTLRVDGQVQRVLAVSVPPVTGGVTDTGEPGTQSVQFDFELSGSALIEVYHDHKDDLAEDDWAAMTVAPPKRLHVLLVTEGNAFLEQSIKALGVRRLTMMTPGRFEDQDPHRLRRGGWDGSSSSGGSGGSGGAEGFDVAVFDRYAPKETPVVDSLYFGAAPPIAGLKLLPPSPTAARTQLILDWQRDHPLMRYVALDDVILSEPGRLSLPLTADVLATAQSGPVMAEVSVDGVHHVIAGFELFKSNWPIQVSFPVFMSNAITWLGLGGQSEAGLSYQPGQVAVVPVRGEGTRVTYEGPVALTAPVSQGRAVLPIFQRVGVYHSDTVLEKPWDQLAVNLLDPIESDLRPAEKLQVGGSAARAQAGATVVRREVWPWFTWGALAVLMVEWIVYTRRMHL